MKRFYLSIFACIVFAGTYAQPGTLDPSFGFSGIMIQSLGNNYHVVNAVAALQPDGKIVVAGTVDTAYKKRAYVMRFDSLGMQDFTFANGQNIATQAATPQGRDTIYAVALQADGKVVTAGVSWNSTISRVLVMRYNADGTNDNTFGTGGRIVLQASSGGSEAHSVIVQDDQKIVIGGYIVSNNKTSFLLVRLTTTGIKDTNFGTNGVAITSINTSEDKVYSLALQADQKILAGGYTIYYNQWPSIYREFALVRYLTNGTIDNQFGTAGVVTTNVGHVTGYNEIRSLAVTTSNQILAGGKCVNGGATDADFGVVRYNFDGSIDSAFATNGIAYTDFNNETDDFSALALKPDGKFVAGGSSVNHSGLLLDFALAQYNEDGNPDVYFGSIGKVTNNLGSLNDQPFSALVQPDEKIILTGSSEYGSNVVVGMARYIGSPVTGIAERNKDLTGIDVYPNPAHNLLFIKSTGNEMEQVNIYNITGTLVITMPAGGVKQTLNTESLPAGMYIAEVITKTESVKRVWVKQ